MSFRGRVTSESRVRVLDGPSNFARDLLFVFGLAAVALYVFMDVVIPIRKQENVLDQRLRETGESIRSLEVRNQSRQKEARALTEDPAYVEYLLRREARYTRRDEK
ncbi:MAG: hypothetical protein QF752_09025 [Planctomycetota bacterium]|nr:hypothetical protein [Planctomycetota bacterium]